MDVQLQFLVGPHIEQSTAGQDDLPCLGSDNAFPGFAHNAVKSISFLIIFSKVSDVLGANMVMVDPVTSVTTHLAQSVTVHILLLHSSDLIRSDQAGVIDRYSLAVLLAIHGKGLATRPGTRRSSGLVVWLDSGLRVFPRHDGTH